MSALASVLGDKITSRSARTGVVGLGYVGLPLAVEFARSGFHTTGIDLDERKIEAINAGRSYIPDVSTDDVATVPHSRPTRRDDRFRRRERARHHQHLRADAAAEDQGPRHVVHRVGGRIDCQRTCTRACSSALESTTYPGTTEEVVQPLLEANGLQGGHATSSWRFRPSASIRATRHSRPTTSRKSSAGSRRRARRSPRALYGTAIETIVPVSSTRVAEMVKLLENTFRAVNIGLVNELALMCDRMNIDVWEVVEAARTKPFGFMAFYPGPGLGGHCIPIDPVLPVVEGEAERLRSAVHRAGRTHQRRDAALRGREGRRGAQLEAQSA